MTKLTCSALGRVVAPALLSLAAVTSAFAAPNHESRVRYEAVTFRLQVTRAMPAGATFWVAYGPLAGRFGVIRLQPQGHGLYAGSRPLPVGARSRFSYVMGQGVAHTPAGAEPGGRVITIQVSGPMTVGQATAPLVHWQGPLG